MTALFTKDTKEKKSIKKLPTKKKTVALPGQAMFVGFIKNPRLTEKAYAQSQVGKYVFDVIQNATKQDVKKAVESVYNVEVENIATINMKPKSKRFGRTLGKTSGKRKAIVTLKKGQAIDLFGDSK